MPAKSASALRVLVARGCELETPAPDFAAYRAAASTLFPFRGPWAYDAWAAINDRFWGGSLSPGPILWGLTAGCLFGSYNPNNNAITLHEALPGRDFAEEARKRGELDWVMANRDQQLNSWGLGPEQFGIGTALGTLLHESMHQAHHQRGLHYPDGRKPFTTESHHNEIWVRECERIAGMIGLPQQIWPIYVERKEHVAEVRLRLGLEANALSAKQLNNRRRWKWAPTVNGEEIEVCKGFWRGQPVASESELTCFPRISFERYAVARSERTALILGKG
jgi:hypothetical protein